MTTAGPSRGAGSLAPAMGLLSLLGAFVRDGRTGEVDPQAPAPSSARASTESLLPPRAIEALRRGLDFLVAEQANSEDGSLPRGDARQHYAPVGVTALAALAWLGEGSVEGRGRRAPSVARAVEYLAAKCDLGGGPRQGYIHADGDGLSRMHGHGYATLALAEAYGMFGPGLRRGGGRRLEEALRASVSRIAQAQGETGGWYYDPEPTLEHEGSVTICLVQALRAARDAGIAVEKRVIDRALDYVHRLQKPDGSFRYQLGSDHSSVALTAAAVATLQSMGEYDSASVRSGIDFLERSFEARYPAPRFGLDPTRKEPFPHYERFYLAQALWQMREPRLFAEWFAAERERLLETQAPDGSWRDSPYGAAYATASNCLTLEVPLGVLPIFQR